jgi:hypothetical protein
VIRDSPKEGTIDKKGGLAVLNQSTGRFYSITSMQKKEGRVWCLLAMFCNVSFRLENQWMGLFSIIDVVVTSELYWYLSTTTSAMDRINLWNEWVFNQLWSDPRQSVVGVIWG